MINLRLRGAAVTLGLCAAFLAGGGLAQAQTQHAVVNGEHVQPHTNGRLSDPSSGVAVDPSTESYVPPGTSRSAPVTQVTDFYGKPFGAPEPVTNKTPMEQSAVVNAPASSVPSAPFSPPKKPRHKVVKKKKPDTDD